MKKAQFLDSAGVCNVCLCACVVGSSFHEHQAIYVIGCGMWDLWLLKRYGYFISIICEVVIFHIKQVTLLRQFHSYIQYLAIYMGDDFLLPLYILRPFYTAVPTYKHI